MGIETVEDLRELGWEDACVRWSDAYPLRLNVNAFSGVVAATEGVDWQELDVGWKARIRALKARLARTQALTAGPPTPASRRRRA